jgi:hypothetical protein
VERDPLHKARQNFGLGVKMMGHRIPLTALVDTLEAFRMVDDARSFASRKDIGASTLTAAFLGSRSRL